MNYDERPTRPVVVPKRFFDDGPHVLKEVFAQRRFVSRCFFIMRNNDAALAGGLVDRPGQILFDTNRKSRAQSAIQTIAPLAVIGITVVSIQCRLVVIQQVQSGCLRE